MALASRQEQAHETSIVTALGHAAEAGQHLLMNRIDLARLDVLELIGRIERGRLLVVLGTVVATVGWLALTAAVAVLLEHKLTWPGSVALVGLFNALIGATLIAVGLQPARQKTKEHGTAADNGMPQR